MRKIYVSDITMKLSDSVFGNILSFRQKIEMAKQLDRLGVDIIETSAILNGKQDTLLVKSLASAITRSTLAIPVDITDFDSIDCTWDALKEAKHPRLQVVVPVSTVQMEYVCHKKPAAIIETVGQMVARCAALCSEVEFVAQDFSRGDSEFLMQVIDTAIEAGATIITVHDNAGTLFTDEMSQSTVWLRNHLPDNIRLGIICNNEMSMADACAIAAVMAGADEVKTVPHGNAITSLKRFIKVLNIKAEMCNAYCDVNMTELQRITDQIKAICMSGMKNNGPSVFNTNLPDRSALILNRHDDKAAVMGVVNKLGYDLEPDDMDKVYEAFLQLANENTNVDAKELDAIVASVAFQAPPTYKLNNYIINSSNVITATCHLRLEKDNTIQECVCLGDGPVDAAFQAIEQLVGRRYPLDDFQIQSVTEGREAMGRAVVRLCHEGKVFPGCGISRDIVGASIMAYLSAVNKIVFEENNA